MLIIARKEKVRGLFSSMLYWNFTRLREIETERENLTPEERIEYDKERVTNGLSYLLDNAANVMWEEFETYENKRGLKKAYFSPVSFFENDYEIEKEERGGKVDEVTEMIENWRPNMKKKFQALANEHLVALIAEGKTIIREHKVRGKGVYKKYARHFGKRYFGALWYRRFIAWLTQDYDPIIQPLKTLDFANSYGNWSHVLGDIRRQLDKEERKAQDPNNDCLL